MGRVRRYAVVPLLAGLLGLPAPAYAATDHVAFYADDPQTGPLTFDTATGATVTATYNDARNGITVTGTQGSVQHSFWIWAYDNAPLVPGTYTLNTGYAAGTTCGSFSSGGFTITELANAGDGSLATYAATYDAVCHGRRVLGTVRYHSAAGWQGVHAPRPDFPGTLVGQTSAADVTVTAAGTLPVTLGATTLVSERFAVTADGCAGETLAAGESCTVSVSFTPAAMGAVNATLSLGADTARGAVVVPLAAYAVLPPAAPVSIRTVAGDDGVGLAWAPPPAASGVPAITGYRVYRDGSETPLATVTTQHYADPAGAGETHTYRISAIAGDAGEGALSAPVTGTVPAAVTETTGTVNGVSVDTLHHDWAVATATVPSPAPGVLTVVATGAPSLTFRPVSGSAWAPGPMTAVVGGLVNVYQCDAVTTELTVHEAKVHADGTPVTLALSGDVPCGPTPVHVEVRYAATTPLVAGDTSPDYVEFPATAPGAVAASKDGTIKNNGSADLVLGTATVPAPFTLTADTCSGATVAPGASCAFAVGFAPASAAAYQGHVTFPDNTPRGHRAISVKGASTAVPGPVGSLTAHPYVGRTVLRWTASESYPPIDWYLVYRATSPDGPYKQTQYLGTRLEHVDANVVPGQRYYYKVRAANDDGYGAYSTVSAVAAGRELVYTADTGSGVYHLTAQGLPGGDPMRLTTTAKDEEDPAFNADGSKLAFTREDVAGRLHVYRAAANGSSAVRVAGDVGDVAWTYRNPRWSPDGKRLAYACRPLSQGWWDLCVRSMVSGGVKKVPAVLPIGGSWLSNGNELLVVSATSPPTIQVVAYDNAYRIAIPGTANARQVALSPDESRITWTRYEGDDLPELGGGPRWSLRVSPLSGGAGVVLQGSGYSNDPSWSEDSATVYYTYSPPGSGPRDVWSAKAVGGGHVRHTDTPDVDEDNVTVRDLVTPVPSPAAARPMADFTGDGKAEIAVWRPGTGAWRIRGLPTVYWGRLGDIPVAADYNGDRKADRAVFRPSTGTWHVYGKPAVKYGRAGDVPVPADYNGDGKAELAVFRPSTGQWYVYGRAPVVFGKHGDVPVPSDFNGDRKADIAIYRPTSGTWAFRGRGVTDWYEGTPVPADYLGRGSAQVAIFRGTDWLVGPVIGFATVPRSYHDVPAYGNFNGDRRAEPGVYNPTLGTWRVMGQSTVVWGVPGDIPV